jgi:hypothetical protein
VKEEDVMSENITNPNVENVNEETITAIYSSRDTLINKAFAFPICKTWG